MHEFTTADDSESYLRRVNAIELSAEPGGEAVVLAGYDVISVPTGTPAEPGRPMMGRTYVKDIINGRLTVYGLNLAVDPAELVRPEALALDLEERFAKRRR